MKKHLLIRRGFTCDPATGFWFNRATRKGTNERAIWRHRLKTSNLASSCHPLDGYSDRPLRDLADNEFEADGRCGEAARLVTTHRAGANSRLHFKNLIDAKKRRGDRARVFPLARK